MSTSKAIREITPFPYPGPNPAHAVFLFLAEHTRVRRNGISYGVESELHNRICELLASAVSDRLREFSEGSSRLYELKEEVELIFTRAESEYRLSEPQPVVDDLTYRFRGAEVLLEKSYIDPAPAITGANTFVLRVSPLLVTLGGIIFWQPPAE